jgi:hypothetical protein
MLNKAVEKELVLKDSVKLVSINERSIIWYIEYVDAIFGII